MDKKKLNQYVIDNNSKDLSIMIETGDVEQNINFLKEIEFLIDRRGTKKFGGLIDELENKFTSGLTQSYIRQVKIINEVFEGCARLKMK